MSTYAGTTIRSQLTRLSLILVTVSVALSLAGTLYFVLGNERSALDKNLENSASILSEMPTVQAALLGEGSQEELRELLDQVTRQVQDIDLILVGDTQGVLYYAHNAEYVGQVYEGAQADALAGAAPYTLDERGPMGSDHSAYAPVRDEEGTVIGFVVVGLYMRSLSTLITKTVLILVGIGVVAAVLGTLLAGRLSARIKGALLGYEPDALARLFHQQEDILEALEEGILAIDREDRVIYLNSAAAKMMGQDRRAMLGRTLREVYPRSRMDRVLHTGRPEYNVSLYFGQDVQVISDRLPLFEKGVPVGVVGIFRNRTEVTRLAADLTGVRHMVEAMRAYTHEFINKLHVISGLLQLGEVDKAQAYIMDTTQVQREAVGRIANQIEDPSVAALLVGKTSRANELGIRLTLDKDSRLTHEGMWIPPDAYVTMLGNLIENAIEALNQSSLDNKEISVSIREGKDDILLCVEDTGPGLPLNLKGRLFDRGTSTKGTGRGTGLALVQDVVNAYGGTIRVETERGIGSSFFISFDRRREEGTDCTKS